MYNIGNLSASREPLFQEALIIVKMRYHWERGFPSIIKDHGFHGLNINNVMEYSNTLPKIQAAGTNLKRRFFPQICDSPRRLGFF
jgi:hypothetical protein